MNKGGRLCRPCFCDKTSKMSSPLNLFLFLHCKSKHTSSSRRVELVGCVSGEQNGSIFFTEIHYAALRTFHYLFDYCTQLCSYQVIMIGIGRQCFWFVGALVTWWSTTLELNKFTIWKFHTFHATSSKYFHQNGWGFVNQCVPLASCAAQPTDS